MKNWVINKKTIKEEYNRKFKPVFREIELIELQINQKKGWFIFKTHICSKKELLESQHFSKINSITEKIGDDIENWTKNNHFSFIEKKIYTESREKVDDQLHNLRKKIIKRQDTFWESFVSTFGDFIERIMDNMPILNTSWGLVGGVIKALLLGSKVKKYRLPSSR